MSRKALALVLIFLLSSTAAMTSVPAAAQEARQVEQVRENVRKLGVGEAARVEVKLQDGRTLKGYIREAGDDRFVVADARTGNATTVTYSEVTQLKGKNGVTGGKASWTAAKVVGVIAAVVGGIVLVLYIVASQLD